MRPGPNNSSRAAGNAARSLGRPSCPSFTAVTRTRLNALFALRRGRPILVGPIGAVQEGRRGASIGSRWSSSTDLPTSRSRNTRSWNTSQTMQTVSSCRCRSRILCVRSDLFAKSAVALEEIDHKKRAPVTWLKPPPLRNKRAEATFAAHRHPSFWQSARHAATPES